MDTTELRKVAEAASPGPWTAEESLGDFYVNDANNDCVAFATHCFVEGAICISEEDSKHIATFNPNQVLAMLDEIDGLKKELEQAKSDQLEYATIGYMQGAEQMKDKYKELKEQAEKLAEAMRFYYEADGSELFPIEALNNYNEWKKKNGK